MSSDAARPAQIVWATRGRSWGFRFLLDGGMTDPLHEYEDAFGEGRDAQTAWLRDAGRVALRFPDPMGRRDAAGRVIPHEFILFGHLADAVDSVESGIREVWPLVSRAYSRFWDTEHPPSQADLERALQGAEPGEAHGTNATGVSE